MDGTAILLTIGHLAQSDAKTAHGLLRGTERFRVLGVVDRTHQGKDAGAVLDGKPRGIPIFATIAEARAAIAETIDFAVIGVATPGGQVTAELRALCVEALSAGMSVVNGLHDFLSEMPDLARLATERNLRLVDVRKPPPKDKLHFWSGAITRVTCPKIAVLGTDCAIGKRTTARFLVEAARAEGLRAHMIYTGQTGWMQGSPYGFILDSIYNDFVSGELEHAIVSCFDTEKPHLIVIEGQAALRNPSGPCGSEFLVSGRADAVILQCHLTRRHYHGFPEWGEIPPIEDEIALIGRYRVPVIGVTTNSGELAAAEAVRRAAELQARLDLPTVSPLHEGVGRIFEAIKSRFNLAA